MDFILLIFYTHSQILTRKSLVPLRIGRGLVGSGLVSECKYPFVESCFRKSVIGLNENQNQTFEAVFPGCSNIGRDDRGGGDQIVLLGLLLFINVS